MNLFKSEHLNKLTIYAWELDENGKDYGDNKEKREKFVVMYNP